MRIDSWTINELSVNLNDNNLRKYGLVCNTAVCATRNDRLYVVGGCSRDKTNGNIAVSMWHLKSSRPSSSGGCEDEQMKVPCETRGANDGFQWPAIVSTCIDNDNSSTWSLNNSPPSITAYQAGDIPGSRIGHSAVVSSRSTIILFGGEAVTYGIRCLVSADVYEATPDSSSGTLVWRKLLNPVVTGGAMNSITLQGASAGGTPTQGVPHSKKGPGSLTFHASCSAILHGEWVMLIHGGINEQSIVTGTLWALRLAEMGEGDVFPVKASWEQLAPQGHG